MQIYNADFYVTLPRTKPHKCIKEKKEKAEERTGYEETISVLYIARQEIRIAYTGP
jgi:hypothetical protein